jgi:hypothetical protein
LADVTDLTDLTDLTAFVVLVELAALADLADLAEVADDLAGTAWATGASIARKNPHNTRKRSFGLIRDLRLGGWCIDFRRNVAAG